MGITLKESVVLNVDLSVSAPAHQVLGKLERAVLNHFSIQATIGGIVDVFEEDTIHRRLYGRTQFLGVYFEYGCLG